MDAIDLIDLQKRIRDGLDGLFPSQVWVRAEVASIQVKTNGHCYLDLCQSDESGRVTAKAKAVIWRSRYYALALYYRETTGAEISVGHQIMVRSAVNYSELYGLTLVIDEIEPQYTIGAAEMERQRTIEMLKADGLLEKQQSLTLAALPYRLAVISASSAAGYGDFTRHLGQNEYGFVFEVTLFESSMQGAQASESIIDALERVETSEEPFDAVLILRGGGSALDLSCFDDYDMCFAIANSRVPVFTAIGHERDYHVADMVAYRFLKTPTALADEFISCFAAEDERISSYSSRLRLAFSAKISALEYKIGLLGERVRSADPRTVLSRGYSLVAGEDGVVIKSAGKVKRGDKIRILFEDGEVNAEVI